MNARNSVSTPDLIQQHQDLLAALAAVRTRLDTRAGGTHDVLELLNSLAAQLESHFALEEAGGYLHEVLDDVPELQALGKTLAAQHAALRESFRALREWAGAGGGGGGDAWWHDLTRRFAAFQETFLRHEQAEDRLVQDAALTDTGAKD